VCVRGVRAGMSGDPRTLTSTSPWHARRCGAPGKVARDSPKKWQGQCHSPPSLADPRAEAPRGMRVRDGWLRRNGKGPPSGRASGARFRPVRSPHDAAAAMGSVY